MEQSQFEFDIHESPDIKDVISKYEIDPLTNNKDTASYSRKQENFIYLTLPVKVN
jgi:hypothetical protein